MTGSDVLAPQGTLNVVRNGAVATVLMDNQKERNALTKEMWQQFIPTLDMLGADAAVKVVVVRGAGDHFSAGANLRALHGILLDQDTGRHDGGHVSAAEEALARFPKPTIAAVDGYCAGGAWQIAGACDIRMASDRAAIGLTPAKIGIVYPLSGIERLVRLVGPATAKFLLFSGDFVEAGDAAALGLVTRVFPADRFWPEIDAFSQRLATRSQLSIHAMKDLVDAIAEGAADVRERSASWQLEMAASTDPEVGINAFLAKEAPAFTWTPSGPGSRPGPA